MEDEKEQKNSEIREKTSSDETPNKEGQMNHNQQTNKENSDPNLEKKSLNDIQQRRHDEPSALSFEICELKLFLFFFSDVIIFMFS